MGRRADLLMAFAGRFELDGDLLRCKRCIRTMHIVHDDEDFLHGCGCRFSDHRRPWGELREALDAKGAPDA